MAKRRYLATLLVALGAVLATANPRGQEQAFGWIQFEEYLESLRQLAGVPGLSAAIVKDGRIVWERGLGFQDVEAGVRAAPDTTYHVVGLTQTVSTALLLECAEQGRISLDTTIDRFTQLVPVPGVTLRHLLTHTSDAVPGTSFRFDLSRFAALTPAIESCWPGRSYREVLTRRILGRLGMAESVPGQNVVLPTVVPTLAPAIFDQLTLERYGALLARLARPYGSGGAPATYPSDTLDAASGLVTTVRDLARFDAALDDLVLLQAATVELMWTPPAQALPAPLPTQAVGPPLPHALGWFVQTHEGELLAWQFGHWPGVTSSLIIKVPRQRLTFILLANSDGLASSSQLESGDVTRSLFARLFLRFFL